MTTEPSRGEPSVAYEVVIDGASVYKGESLARAMEAFEAASRESTAHHGRANAEGFFYKDGTLMRSFDNVAR